MKISVVINPLKRSNSNGEFFILARIHYQGKTAYIRLKHLPKVNQKHFRNKYGEWVSSKVPAYLELNATIRKELNLLHKHRDKLISSGALHRIQDIKEAYQGKRDANQLVHAYLFDYLQDHKNEFKPNTYKAYISLIHHVRDYFPNWRVNMLTRERISGFKEHLERKNHKGSTQKKYLDKFRKAVRKAESIGLIDFDPYRFDHVKPKIVKPEIEQINENHFQAISRLDLSDPVLVKVRDYFIFQCLTSFYFSDLTALDQSHLHRITSGQVERVLIRKPRLKTSVVQEVILNPMAKQIFDTYYNENAYFLFPAFCTEQTFNKHLKTLAKLAEVPVRISNKTARHFARTNLIQQGFSREIIARFLGHTNTRMQEQYGKIETSHLLAEANKIGY